MAVVEGVITPEIKVTYGVRERLSRHDSAGKVIGNSVSGDMVLQLYPGSNEAYDVTALINEDELPLETLDTEGIVGAMLEKGKKDAQLDFFEQNNGLGSYIRAKFRKRAVSGAIGGALVGSGLTSLIGQESGTSNSGVALTLLGGLIMLGTYVEGDVSATSRRKRIDRFTDSVRRRELLRLATQKGTTFKPTKVQIQNDEQDTRELTA